MVDHPLPRIAVADLSWDAPRVADLTGVVAAAWDASELPDLHGASIAVGVGSRGITDLASVVRETCAALRRRGATPFVFPAMGSHGAGTGTGQVHVLESYGVTPSTVEAAVLGAITVEHIGTTRTGIDVLFDRSTCHADGIVVVNRVKPHTTFRGSLGSGLIKMLVVGAGHREGAATFHEASFDRSPVDVLEEILPVILARIPIVLGLGIIENAHHETARVELVPGQRLMAREPEMLAEARALMPTLPFDDVDVLVVDEMGKDISGAGMDPNITGRWFRSSDKWREAPQVTRLIVLDLSAGSAGNGVGIGLADFCTSRLVAAIDRPTTYLNSITALNPVNSQLPIHFDTDEATIRAAIASLGQRRGAATSLRYVRIRNTLALDRMEVSEALVPEAIAHRSVRAVSSAYSMKFGNDGRLAPLGAAASVSGTEREREPS